MQTLGDRRPPGASVPAFNITRAVGILMAVNVAVHILRLLLPGDMAVRLLIYLGFAPSNYFDATGAFALPVLASAYAAPVTYGFLHADAMHLLMNMAFLLAFGTGVERRLGATRFFVFFLAVLVAATAGTVLMYLYTGQTVLVVGASGAVSGLFGAVLRFAFSPRPHLRPAGQRRASNPALIAAVAFVAVNLIFGISGVDPFGAVRAIAWEAHLAGFVAGYLLFPLFEPRQRLPVD